MTTTETKPTVRHDATDAAGTKARPASKQTFMARADIFETKDAYVIVADMPGVDEKSVDITLEKNELTIRGSTDAFKPADYKAIHAEYDEGDYARAFTLAAEVDRDHIQAAVKNGVLRVTLPKAGPVQARKIEVKAN